MGLDLEAQTEYALSPVGRERVLEVARRVAETCGQRKLARASNTSLSVVSAILLSKREPSLATVMKVYWAVSRLESDAHEQARYVKEVLDTVRDRCQRISVRQFAKRAKVDEANLAHVLSGRRKTSRGMLAKLEFALALPS